MDKPIETGGDNDGMQVGALIGLPTPREETETTDDDCTDDDGDGWTDADSQ